jgi:serine protease
MTRSRYDGAFAAIQAVTGLLVAIALTAIPPAAQAQGGPPEFVQREILIQFQVGAAGSQRQEALARVSATVLQRLRAPGLVLARTPRAVPDAVLALRGHPAVAYVQPNFIYRAITTPNDPRFTDGSLWGLNNTGQNSGLADADIDAPEAWDLTTGSGSVVVAVIDTGVDYTHPDLAANIWTNPGETGLDSLGRDKASNGVDDDGNGFVDDVHGWDARNNDGDPMDDHDHGTHVAGTIGAVGNNSLGVVGVNWNVTMVATKFLGADGSGTTAGAVTCLDYLHNLKDRGVNILATSNSWGSGSENDQALKDAIERSHARGILFVAAAGNGDFFGRGINNDSSPFYPASFNNANIIAVAATDRNDRKAPWSNYGAASVDLGAPGVSIWSTIRNGSYDSFSGTSMATPHVTGAAALLRAYDPTITHLQIKDRLLSTGDPNTDLEGRTVSGNRLNVHNALTNTVPPRPPKTDLQVTVTTDKPSYRVGEYGFVFINVTAGGSPVEGASVHVVVRSPSGKQFFGDGVTDANGDEAFLFQARKRDGKGTYTVTVTATGGGYNSGTGTTTFTVN